MAELAALTIAFQRELRPRRQEEGTASPRIAIRGLADNDEHRVASHRSQSLPIEIRWPSACKRIRTDLLGELPRTGRNARAAHVANPAGARAVDEQPDD